MASPSPPMALVRAGVPLPASVRAAAAVNRRGRVIAQATTGNRGSALFMGELGPLLIRGSSYRTESAGSTPRHGNAIAQATTGTCGFALVTAGIMGGPSCTAASTGSTHGYGSSFTATALGAGTGSGRGDVGYVDAVAEAKHHAAQVTEILRIRSRLEVMIDQDLQVLPLTAVHELRAVICELNDLDPAAPVFHWKLPRLKYRLRQELGEDVYVGMLKWDVDPLKIEADKAKLINGASGINRYIEALIAQITYTIMHAHEKKTALKFDHAIYDTTPTFLKTLCDIEGKFHVNIDLLSFTSRPRVTLQQMAANHAMGLLHTFEAVVHYRGIVNAELTADDDPDTLMKDLKQHYNMLLAEEYTIVDYLKGPCDRHTFTVRESLGKLEKDLRPMRLSD